MRDQQNLWQQVEAIKRHAAEVFGEKPSHDIRSTQAYQAYTAMCGEAHWAYKENELDEKLVQLLRETAEKAIHTQRGTHA